MNATAFVPSPEQQKAIEHTGGNLQVIACAGAGKTEAISQRVAKLIVDGAPHSRSSRMLQDHVPIISMCMYTLAMDTFRPSLQHLPDGCKFSAGGGSAGSLKNQADFLRAFFQAWDRIPCDARLALMTYWQESGHPVIVDLTDIRSQFTKGPSRDAVAQYVETNDGATLGFAFFSPIVSLMRVEDVSTLIAHELAHCYLASIDRTHLTKDHDRQEVEANQVVEETWGFPPDAIGLMRTGNFLACQLFERSC